jgi:hypothetical protein
VARYYKGSGPGTHFWQPANDPRLHGFQAPLGAPPGADAAVRHITNFSAPSPYVSVSASYAIARSYALSGPLGVATKAQPGKVWLLEIDRKANNSRLESPVSLIAAAYPDFFAHDGGPDMLSQISFGHMPAPSSIDGFQYNWNVPQELLAVVRALRDAELLADRILPACVVGVRDAW